MPRYRTGFTLIELMVVLVIVGVMFTSAIVFMPGSHREALIRDLERVRVLTGVARDRAMLEANPYGIAIWSEGYAFFRLTGNWQWRPVLDDSALKDRGWDERQWLDLYLDGLKVTLPDKKADHPQIHILPDGNMTAFTLHLHEEGESAAILQFDAMGEGEIRARED